MKIQIQRNFLKACDLFASRDATRYVLNGVYVEPDETGAVLCAIDDKRLLAVRIESTPDGDNLKPFIIPNELIASLPNYAPKQGALTVGFDGVTVSVSGDKTVTMPAICGKYPNWRSTVPLAPSVPLAKIRLNMKQLSVFEKAFYLLFRDTGITIEAASETDVMVIRSNHTSADCIGLLMPSRCAAEKTIPKWALVKEGEAAK